MKASVRKLSTWALASGFTVAGLNHFISPDFYLRIMPSYVPWHRTLVQISGACEIAGGLLVLPSSTRRLAGVGLITLLAAVFPANIEATMKYGTGQRGVLWTVLLWLRLPFQGVLIAWVYWTCLATASPAEKTSKKV